MAKIKTKPGKKAKHRAISSSVEIRYAASFWRENLLDLYVENTKFRNSMDSGHYVYVDGRIVLNSPKYVTYIEGHAELRADIKDDVQAYCLHYRQEIDFPDRKAGQGTVRHPWCHPAYKPRPGVFYQRSAKLPRRKILKNELEDAKKIGSVNDVTLENILAIVGGGHGPGENFSEALARFMKESDITEEDLAELTGLAPKTIQRMRNPNLRTSLKSVVAVCVALSLDLYNSMYLVHLAGFELTNSREDKVYYFILGFAYKESVYDCNRMLERLHMKPLTKL